MRKISFGSTNQNEKTLLNHEFGNSDLYMQTKVQGKWDSSNKTTNLALLLEHRYISITPEKGQSFRVRRFLNHVFSLGIVSWLLNPLYPLYAKAALCQGCYKALRLTESLEKKGSELLDAIPKPFLSLHLCFEPDMVAYSQSFILKALAIPTNTSIYLAAGDGLMEIDGLTSVYTNVYTKSSLLSGQDFTSMHGNTKVALDYYMSVNSDSYVATYFGNMDKMVSAMRTFKGLFKTLFLSRRAFAELISQGYVGLNLSEALWKIHRDDFILDRGSALPDCFLDLRLGGTTDNTLGAAGDRRLGGTTDNLLRAAGELRLGGTTDNLLRAAGDFRLEGITDNLFGAALDLRLGGTTTDNLFGAALDLRLGGTTNKILGVAVDLRLGGTYTRLGDTTFLRCGGTYTRLGGSAMELAG
ncbi:hypothetical protein IFM89_010614 [Coptis chinensis]|uniref:O-fucosyltransferase family protein n=1 Tax=Coptis chinensis TaxID=261450 RepID=A0A835INT2_9MAGN|nr:hypothetical protein IFM89_010614 [Coptis chinensis]